MDKILKAAKKLKAFTIEDIVMLCDIDADMVEKFLQESENIKSCGDKFEYIETIKAEDKFKIIDKDIPSKNSDINVIEACEMFLIIKKKVLTESSLQSYKTFVYAQIIPYFRKFNLKDITVQDIENFRKYMQQNKVSERRIKNILTLLNQIIKYFQNEGYIDKTCVFEIKRIANIPKRQIQILTPEQVAQLFKITNKKYPYLTPIIQNLITLKQPLNTILTGSEQQKKYTKRRIRKDFYKIKQELGLTNCMFDDLRYCNKTKKV